jgi:tetratricopeptide (TPR) repeat protein
VEECTAEEWKAGEGIKLGDFKSAGIHYKRAEQIATSSKDLFQLPQVLQEEAALYLAEHKLPEAEASLRKALSVYIGLRKTSLPQAKEPLSIAKIQEEKLHCCEKLADVLTSAGRYGEAEPLYKETLEQSRISGQPVDSIVRIIRSYTTILRKLHKNALAEKLITEADSATFVSLDVISHLNKETAIFDRNLNHALTDADRANRAASVPRFKTIALAAKRFEKWDLYCSAEHYLGLSEMSLSQLPEAEIAFREALRLRAYQTRNEGYKSAFAKDASSLAVCLELKGDRSEASSLYMQAQRSDFASSCATFEELSWINWQAGKCKSIEVLCDRLEQLIGNPNGNSQKFKPTLASICDRTADCYAREHDYASSERMFRRSIHQYAKTNSSQSLADVLTHFSDLKRNQGEFTAAEKMLDQALILSEANSGKSSVSTAKIMHKLADVYGWEKNYPKADSYYEKVCSLYEENKIKEELAWALRSRAEVCERLGENAKAAVLKKRASNIVGK